MGRLTKRRQDGTIVKYSLKRHHRIIPTGAASKASPPKILSVFIPSPQSHSTAMLLRLRYKPISNFLACALTDIMKHPLIVPPIQNFGFGHFKQFLIVHQKTPELPEKCRKAPEFVVYFKRVFIPLRQELSLQALSLFYHARKYRTISVPQRQVPRAFRPTRPRKAFCRDL